MSAQNCIICNLPVVHEEAWFIGWENDCEQWQHETCISMTEAYDPEPNTEDIQPDLIQTSPNQPTSELEASLEDSLPIQDIQEEQAQPITYEIINDATIFRKEKLFDSLGYSYNVKRRRGVSVDWQCTIRRKDHRCPATVSQKPGPLFVRGRNVHNHLPEVGSATVAKICSRVKSEAVNNIFRPAPAIVEEVLRKELTNEPSQSLPKVQNISRAANRFRQKLRPKDPIDLHFDLDETHLPPQFLQADIWVKERRHIVFASNEQLRHLVTARNWFIDGTFKLCRHPFTQLFTINIFVRRDECAKQVPMVFVLMSGRKSKDYKKVLQAIRDALPGPPSVKTITADFEKAAWKACKEVFPDVSMRGCVFHFTQAIWRKVQELGLQVQYQTDHRTYNFIRKIMALPFLPEDEIIEAFQTLENRVAASPALTLLVQYIRNNWIESTVWPPSTWCVFNRSIRTNNDIEGWHNAINRRAGGKTQLPFYLLIQLLEQESKLVTVQIRLVNEKKLTRLQRRKYRLLQSKIFDLWDEYEQGTKNARQLLRAISYLNGPRTN